MPARTRKTRASKTRGGGDGEHQANKPGVTPRRKSARLQLKNAAAPKPVSTPRLAHSAQPKKPKVKTMSDELDASQIHALALGDGRRKTADAMMNAGLSVWAPVCDPDAKAALEKGYKAYLKKAPASYPTLSLSEFLGKYSMTAFQCLQDSAAMEVGLRHCRELPILSPLFPTKPLDFDELPDSPKTAVTDEAPDASEAPVTGETTEASEATVTSEASSTSELSLIDKAPDTPKVPDIPNSPRTLKAPAAPRPAHMPFPGPLRTYRYKPY